MGLLASVASEYSFSKLLRIFSFSPSIWTLIRVGADVQQRRIKGTMTYMFLDCRYLAHQLEEPSSQASCQWLATLCVQGKQV